MATIKVQNSNVNAPSGFRVTMFWKEDGYFKSKIVSRNSAWHTGTGNEVMARITPSAKNCQKILEALVAGKITLQTLDNIGGDHGGHTEISIGGD